MTPTLVTPIEVEQKEKEKNPTEPVADISGGKTQDLEAFKAAARLYELIPESA